MHSLFKLPVLTLFLWITMIIGMEPENTTTPLHEAVRRGDVITVTKLLREADVNASDKYAMMS